MAVLKAARITVVGNFAVDRVDGAPSSPGGCPSFAAAALTAIGAEGRIVSRFAAADSDLFEPVVANSPIEIATIDSVETTAFGLRYRGEDRVMTVDAVGDGWTVADVDGVRVDTTWVHIAPLLRSDFPPETLSHLAAAGHRLSYDGQGLVRSPHRGPLAMDRRFDPSLLAPLSLLKLNEEEAAVVAGGEFDAAAAAALGVEEVIVTLGSGGCRLYAGGEVHHVSVRPVHGTHATGAGDTFGVAYLAFRAAGACLEEAAEAAGETVARMLDRRRDALRDA